MNIYNEEIDLSLAIQLQAQFEEELRVQRKKDEEKKKSLDVVGHKWNAKLMSLPEPEQEKLSVSLVDPCWENLDPNPSVFDLFLTFNHQFFWGRLMGVEVKWSPRMTLCAGVCSYEGRGGLCSVRLSTPLLKLRPRKDLIETLLHEMIHAYLFVTHNNKDHDAHGPHFHEHMFRINKLAGTKISVYHSFHDEVAAYRQHIWKCDGPCRKRPPYYGLLKRAMNRPPSARDFWWESHFQSCGGTYTKIQEPEGYGAKKVKRSAKDESIKDIRSFFPSSGTKKPKSGKENSEDAVSQARSNVVGLHTPVDSSNSQSMNASRVDVRNATDSNAHGFGKSSGKTNPHNKAINSGNGKVKTGSTMTRSATGSRTIVVRNKKPTKTESKVDDSDTRLNISSFSGTGYVLGVPGSTQSEGRSRLIDEYSRVNARSIPSVGNSNEALISRSNATSDAVRMEPPTICPLCQNPVDSYLFEDHIAECIGDFDPDPDFDSEIQSSSENASAGSVVAKHTNGAETSNNLTNSSISSDGSTNIKNNTSECITLFSDDENDHNTDSTLPSGSPEVLYPCPVCSERFSESRINAHVNNHF